MKMILPPDATKVRFFDDFGNDITHLFKIAEINIDTISANTPRTMVHLSLTNVTVELDLVKDHATVYDAEAYRAHEERVALDQKANWQAATGGKLT